MGESTLTKLEDQVLVAVMNLGENAYGVSIYQYLEKLTGHKLAMGVVYFALDRLAKRGLLNARQGKPTSVRGGMRKRYYSITRSGMEALEKSRDVQTRVWDEFRRTVTTGRS